MFSIVLRVAKKGEGYCSKEPNNCLVCDRDRTYYDVKKVA